MENSTESSNRGLKIALGIVIALFAVTAYFTFDTMNKKDAMEADLTMQKEEVMQDLNNMADQYDIAIGDNEVANAKLVEARGRIQGLMDSLKVSDNNVRSLWRYRKKFLALEDEMDALLEENDALKQANTLLSTVLDSTKIQLEERTVFNDSLLAQNTELANIMENAAVLSTAGLIGNGVIVRSSGKLIPTERARRADKLKICFTVTRNSLVPSGDNEFYIQVLDPKNNVLGLNTQVNFEEKVLNYSLISKFNYESKNLDICEFIDPRGDESFNKGRYIINVFNMTELVSTSEFTLR